MDENEYRNLYNELNPNRCIFEKAINNRRCDCVKMRRFNLATREGIACESPYGVTRCTTFLESMRQNARFSLKVVTIEGPMPHNKELQVQAGGCIALMGLLDCGAKHELPHIHQVVERAHEKYGSIETFPFGEIVKGIVGYQSRKKRNKR